MGRTKGAKNKAYSSRFKSYEGIYPKDKHLRLTDYMLKNKKCLSLSATAFRLYCHMKLWACGRDEVNYSISMAKTFIKSNTTFIKARDELIAAGFIDFPNKHIARDKRETALYVFSNRWHADI